MRGHHCVLTSLLDVCVNSRRTRGQQARARGGVLLLLITLASGTHITSRCRNTGYPRINSIASTARCTCKTMLRYVRPFNWLTRERDDRALSPTPVLIRSVVSSCVLSLSFSCSDLLSTQPLHLLFPFRLQCEDFFLCLSSRLWTIGK